MVCYPTKFKKLPTFQYILFLKKIAFVVLFMGFTHWLVAQDHRRSTGLIMDQSAVYNAIPKAPKIDDSKYDIPKIKSLKQYCPEPGDQADMGACVAWALGYSAMTICRSIRDGVTDRCAISEEAYSAPYLFNHIKEGRNCRTGARFSKALEFLKNEGDCMARDFNVPADDCSYLPTSQFDQSRITKAVNYSRFFDEDDSTTEKIDRLKMAIATNNPVIIGMDISLDFYTLDTSHWVPRPNLKIDGQHAMVAIGYNDILKEIEIMNSYGLNWGDQGFFKVSYEDFGRLVRYGFQIVIDQKKLIPPKNTSYWSLFDWLTWGNAQPDNLMQGEIYFDHGVTVDSFQTTLLSYDSTSNIFQSLINWQVGDFFHLRFHPHQHYVYIFSYDPTNQTARWEYVADNFAEQNSSVVKIPDSGQGFEIISPGDNYLCLLFSKKRLETSTNNYLEELGQCDGDMYQHVLKTFEISHEDLENISYFSNLRFVYNKEQYNGDIIPIILKFSSSN